MNEILGDLAPAFLNLACCWIGSGLLFSLVFSPIIMGPYHWARFRRFNLLRKLFVWLWCSKHLFIFWPIEAPKLAISMSQFCYDEDFLYHVPACRFIGHAEISYLGAWREYFYQIGDRFIRGNGKDWTFYKQEEVVIEMMTNQKWFHPKVPDKYMSPAKISGTQSNIGER